MLRPSLARFVIQTTAIYAVVAGVWILTSDWILGKLVRDHELLTELAVAKGWLFVAVTALLLYGLLRRAMNQLQREMESQERAQAEMRQWADAFTNCAHGIGIGVPGDNRILACNPALARMAGRTSVELVGTSVFALYDPKDQAHVRACLEEADRNGRVQFESGMCRADGTVFPVQMDIVSVRGSDGSLRYRVATAQDIGVRQAAERGLRESEQRLRAIVENLTEGLLITDAEGRPLMWNRAFVQHEGLQKMYLRPPEEAEGVAQLEFRTVEGALVPPRDWPLARVLRGEPLADVVYRVRERGGADDRVYSFHGSLAPNVAGRPVAVLTNIDVTSRIHALEALKQSEQRFRAVVENIREVFWIRDLQQRRIEYVSPAFETIWGRKPQEFVGGPPEAWLATMHPEDRERARRTLPRKDGATRFDLEYRIVRPDGSIRWVHDQAFPVAPDGDRPSQVVGVAQDITERKQLEAQFLRAQRMEAIGTLAGGIAHDLNNILAPMLMAAGLLKERVADAHDRDMLGMVERSARRGADIIRQLLTFSRGVEGERGAIQPRHLVKEIGAIIRETFPREITFVDETPTDLWPVVADATQIHQVLVNLCVNARDAMPGGGTLTIAAANRVIGADEPEAARGLVPGRYAVLTVSDTGTGMSPYVLERIFSPFFTTKDPGKGTGLGLSTVLGIVRGHGGLVTVESEPGRGSRFHVFLPAAPVAVEEEGMVNVAPLPVGHGELVLVVDDEEAIRDSTRHLLEQHNYRVLTASDGKHALTLYLPHRDEIHLVLTDMMMPEMGGVALVRALRLINPALKVIATSGLGEDTSREELQSLRVEALPKPCGPKPLLEAIRRALDEPAAAATTAAGAN